MRSADPDRVANSPFILLRRLVSYEKGRKISITLQKNTHIKLSSPYYLSKCIDLWFGFPGILFIDETFYTNVHISGICYIWNLYRKNINTFLVGDGFNEGNDNTYAEYRNRYKSA